MRIPISPLVVGALVVAGTAFAQTDSTRRTTSTRRIPISKETPVVTRTDTVTVFHTDTVTQYQHDTVTITRVDTVTTSPGTVAMPVVLRRIGGFYFGVAGGAAVPQGDEFTNAQSTGWHVEVPLGWDPIDMPLGVRVNAAYSRFNKRGFFENFSGSPQIFSADGDVKLRLPVNMLWDRRFQVYGVGGATYNRFRSIAQFNPGTGITTIGDSVVVVGTVTPVDDSWHNAWGWNAGGGVQFGWRNTNLFVESRYVHFGHNGDLNQIPIIVGLSWY